MSTRPRLVRSVPFWALVGGSVASAVAGVLLLVDKLGGMDVRLTDGTATSSDVYVGQIWGVLGAILVGVGLIGLALALTLGVLRSFVPASPEPAVVDSAEESDVFAEDEDSESDADTADTDVDTADADELGYASDLGYEQAATPAR